MEQQWCNSMKNLRLKYLLLCSLILFVVCGSTQKAQAFLSVSEEVFTKLSPIPINRIVKDANGIDMALIPGGKFTTGITREDLLNLCLRVQKSNSETICNDLVVFAERLGVMQQKEVEVSPFWMDVYEVTHKSYLVCSNMPSKACLMLGPSDPNFINDQNPQMGVRWYDAVYFCNIRGARLPTALEWEYAARGASGAFYSWGNSPNLVLPDKPYQVGSIPQNVSWSGVYDLSGNVAEWVEDRFTPFSNKDNWKIDTLRITRGGSWDNKGIFLTSFYPNPIEPDAPPDSVGFRCARTSDPQNK